ncbi:MAG TPA: MFS transporter [Clostridiales bacterium]|jgi:Na+/melibiose symporter-like transporter|nr:MFS transporter [Clostridiales bacterium]HOL79543.1 MFS transporter [Clostridiales bacterium]HPP68488.1 MFS transporter [Clostridiales bacterium]
MDIQTLAKDTYTRRYVNRKETIAYVLFDSSKSFNIDEYQTRFIIDVLKIDLYWNTTINFINGIWDVINDSILGSLIDKTKTRWGKFRPYLLAYALPGTALTCLYWLSPLFFDKNPLDMRKIAFWLILAMAREAVGTLREISETGLLANITPNPEDRVRLYTTAEVVSGLWESFPQIIMGALIDLVNHKKIKMTMDNAFIGMGTFCTISGGILALFFSIYSTERIAQSRERHNYKEGFRTIINNKPMLIILVSDLISKFPVGVWEHNYFIDVLGSSSLRNVIIIPGAPLSILSYTYINQVRARFSTKSLWIFGQHLKDVITLGIFVIGSMRGIGPKGIYQNRLIMTVLLMVRDIFYKGTLSINKILPREILTDALDYCEWKFGYRTEGVTLATKSMAYKLFRNVTNSFNSAIMKKAGYSLDAGFGKQSEKTKYFLFAMSMLMPAATGLLGIIPKLFYDLSGDKRRRMYEELAKMRLEKMNAYERENKEQVLTEV